MKYWLETIAVVAVIAFAAIFFVQNAFIQGTLPPGEKAYTGSDDAATKIIGETGYQPWISPLWTPPSSEIETLIFCIQAALGALVIGYFFGYYKGKKDSEQPKQQNGR